MGLAFFGDKKSPLARLKRGQYDGAAELRDLIDEIAEDPDVSLDDLVWGLTHTNRDVRVRLTELVVERKLPGTFQAVLKAALAATGAPQRILVKVLPKVEDAEAIPLLVRMMEKGKDDQRRFAADVLLGFPVQRIGKQVLALLKSQDDELRVRAVGKLAEAVQQSTSGIDPRLRQLLTELTEDPLDRIRLKAFQLLSTQPDDKFIGLVLERLRHERFTVKKQLISILENTQIGRDDAVLDTLIPLLGEGDDLIRNTALRVATRAGDPAEVIRRIVVYSKSLMGWMRDRIHQTISELGEALLDPIIELLHHEDQEVRSSALLFASGYQDPRLVGPCIQLLSDDDWWIRVVAMDALGRFGDERAVEPLIRCLADPEMRWSAVEALTRIGSADAIQHIARLLGDDAVEVRLEVIRALEVFSDRRTLPLLDKVMQNDAELTVRERAMAAYKGVAAAHDVALDEKGLKKQLALTSKGERAIDRLLVETRRMGASDLHLSPLSPARARRDGELIVLGDREFSHEETARLVDEMLTERQRQRFEEKGELDFCYEIAGAGRYRTNIYRERKGTGFVARVIPNEIPTFAALRIPDQLSDIASYHQGLVIVSGASGSGKTSTLAALVNLLNESKRCHVLTLEDPIEYVHTFKNSLINQREIEKHTEDFPAALRAALREDPDVIVVGEMRDAETMRLAITAAETGHLVIATMHTTSAHKTVGRLIDAFPPREQAQIRTMLSESLKLVINQSLLPAAAGHGRVASFEILVVTSAIGSLIRENKLTLIPSLMTIGRNLGMRTVDDALRELVDEHLISPETAYLRARSKEEFEPMVSRSFLEGQHAA